MPKSTQIEDSFIWIQIDIISYWGTAKIYQMKGVSQRIGSIDKAQHLNIFKSPYNMEGHCMTFTTPRKNLQNGTKRFFSNIRICPLKLKPTLVQMSLNVGYNRTAAIERKTRAPTTWRSRTPFSLE